MVARLLRDGASVKIQVTGHSMLPLVRSGDTATLTPLRDRRPRVGDILVVASAAGLLVHRLVGRSEGRVVTRGDCAEVKDAPAAARDVIGIVERVERRGRRVRLGSGPEAVALALLSRSGAIRRTVWLYGRLRRGRRTRPS
jgi:phage repressor protein C with HTH and peptisase S24 domain